MLENLMFQRADWYNATLSLDNTNTQYHSADALVTSSVPCCIQPMSAKELEFYLNRGLEVSHTIFTNNVAAYQRNDRLKVGSRIFIIVGVRNLIELNRVMALDCVEYQGANKRE